MKKVPTKLTVSAILFFFIFLSLDYADQREERVDKLFSAWDKTDSPGWALAIVYGGRIIYKQGYGMANLEHNIPITPQSVFYIEQDVLELIARQKELNFAPGEESLYSNSGYFLLGG